MKQKIKVQPHTATLTVAEVVLTAMVAPVVTAAVKTKENTTMQPTFPQPERES